MKFKKKLYLDIDGVLLTNKNTKPADDSSLFIEYIVDKFDCFWLTTHCKGDIGNTMKYMARYFDEKTLKVLTEIKATNWTNLKTEAIDFSHEFVWIEDYPFNSEKEVLLSYNRLDSLVLVDLNNRNELRRVIDLFDTNSLLKVK
jgi:hypothetical protein